jgi:peptide/nickel transport system ATP-binding protein
MSAESEQGAAGADIAFAVEHLSVSYPTAQGWVQAVRDVSFSVRQGELVGLAGESGSGKSTLVLAATRVLRPPAVTVSGRVSVVGRDVLALSPRELRALRWRHFSFVPQSAMNALNPLLTIREAMRDVVRAHQRPYSVQEADHRAENTFRIVELPVGKLDSYPHQLSGGQRQRAAIALALILDPRLIIMDEPTTALDVVAQRQILALIRDLQRERGFAVLLISHDLSLLLEIAHEVVVLYAGKVMEMGRARTLVRDAHHPYSRALIRSFPPLHGARRRQEGIAGSPPNMLNPPPGCPFAPRCRVVIPSVCDRVMPPLIDHEGRFIACHRYTNEPPEGAMHERADAAST